MPSEWTIDTLRELLEQRFRLHDRALELVALEMERRISECNHALKLAKEKERDFVSRDAFDTFITRTADDFAVLRREIQITSNLVAAARENSANALATALREQTTTSEARFGRIETTLAASGGRDKGIGNAWAALLGIAALVSTCVAVAAVLFNFAKDSGHVP